MNINVYISTILTSSVVSGFIVFIFKTWFENRLKHHFEIQLEKQKKVYEVEIEKLKHQYDIKIEKLKAELNSTVEYTQQVNERRFNLYPKMVELMYRIRNLVREISVSRTINLSGVYVYVEFVKDLEELVFHSRLDLERDGMFNDVHKYKNDALELKKRILDWIYFHEHDDADGERKMIEFIKDSFPSLNDDCEELIKRASEIGRPKTAAV